MSLVPNLGSKREEQDPTISEISLVQVGSENELSFVFPKINLHLLLLHGFCCLDIPRTSARDIWTVSPVHAETQYLSQTSGPPPSLHGSLPCWFLSFSPQLRMEMLLFNVTVPLASCIARPYTGCNKGVLDSGTCQREFGFRHRLLPGARSLWTVLRHCIHSSELKSGSLKSVLLQCACSEWLTNSFIVHCQCEGFKYSSATLRVIAALQPQSCLPLFFKKCWALCGSWLFLWIWCWIWETFLSSSCIMFIELKSIKY